MVSAFKIGGLSSAILLLTTTALPHTRTYNGQCQQIGEGTHAHLPISAFLICSWPSTRSLSKIMFARSISNLDRPGDDIN